jgi:hypothetical protein
VGYNFSAAAVFWGDPFLLLQERIRKNSLKGKGAPQIAVRPKKQAVSITGSVIQWHLNTSDFHTPDLS